MAYSAVIGSGDDVFDGVVRPLTNQKDDDIVRRLCDRACLLALAECHPSTERPSSPCVERAAPFWTLHKQASGLFCKCDRPSISQYRYHSLL